jgi:hypothetical protein
MSSNKATIGAMAAVNNFKVQNNYKIYYSEKIKHESFYYYFLQQPNPCQGLNLDKDEFIDHIFKIDK